MVTVAVLVGCALAVGALWAMAGGELLIQALLGSAAPVLGLASLQRALGRATGRAVALGFASFATISFSVLFFTIGGAGKLRPSRSMGSPSDRRDLAILAVEEAIRPASEREAAARAVVEPHPDLGPI